MSVITRADELKKEAKEHIQKAHASLLLAMDSNTWGASEYNEEHLNYIFKCIQKLNKMLRKL